jgi:UDP-N-acetylmuramate--alanine ligase
MKIKHQNIITYGLNKKANYHIEIEKVMDDKYLLSFYKKDEKIIEFETIKRPNHFLELISILLAFYYEHNFDLKIIVNKIDEFTFPSQRFIVEEYKNNYLINDYCHHPSQIKYNLEQINFYYKNITKIAIFKPDRTSRLVYFKDRFIKELEKYDLAFVLDLANTEEVGIHSSKELCTNKIRYLNTAQDIEKYLSKNENYAISFMSSKNLNREINQIKKIIDKIKI